MLSDAFKRIGTCFNASVNDINTADRRSVKRRSCFRKSKTCIIYVQNAATQAQRSIFRCLALCLINRGEHGRDKFTGCGFQCFRWVKSMLRGVFVFLSSDCKISYGAQHPRVGPFEPPCVPFLFTFLTRTSIYSMSDAVSTSSLFLAVCTLRNNAVVSIIVSFIFYVPTQNPHQGASERWSAPPHGGRPNS
jgi:hypothetical protein